MKASSLTPKKREKQKFHISTAYKDNNKYTVYKREIKKTEKIICTLKHLKPRQPSN